MVCNQWSWPHSTVKIQEKLNYTPTSEFSGIYELSLNKEHKTKIAQPWCSQAGWGGDSPEHPSACSALPPCPRHQETGKPRPGSSRLSPS